MNFIVKGITLNSKGITVTLNQRLIKLHCNSN